MKPRRFKVESESTFLCSKGLSRVAVLDRRLGRTVWERCGGRGAPGPGRRDLMTEARALANHLEAADDGTRAACNTPYLNSCELRVGDFYNGRAEEVLGAGKDVRDFCRDIENGLNGLLERLEATGAERFYADACSLLRRRLADSPFKGALGTPREPS